MNISITHRSVDVCLLASNQDVMRKIVKMLPLADVGRLDVSFTNHGTSRRLFLESISSSKLIFDGLLKEIKHQNSFFRWLIQRQVCVKHIRAKGIDETVASLIIQYLITTGRPCVESLHLVESRLGSIFSQLEKNIDLRLKNIDLTESFISLGGLEQLVNCCAGELESILFSRCMPHATDAMVQAVADQASGLKCIELGGKGAIFTDEGLIHLAEGCINLESVVIHGCDMTDVGVTRLAECCRGLRRIILSNCRHVSNAAITTLGDLCPDLQDVKLRYSRQLTDEAVIHLANHCTHLEAFDLTDCPLITDGALIALAECGRERLTRVDLVCSHRISDVGLIRLAECCTHLTAVDLSHGMRFTDKGVLKLLECCHDLRSLTVHGCHWVTDTTRREIQLRGLG